MRLCPVSGGPAHSPRSGMHGKACSRCQLHAVTHCSHVRLPGSWVRIRGGDPAREADADAVHEAPAAPRPPSPPRQAPPPPPPEDQVRELTGVGQRV
eukprot:166286-Rhodomonas_salina.1